MKSLLENRVNWQSLFLTALLGYFLANLFLFFTPLLTYKPIYMLAIPFAGILGVMMMTQPKALFAIIFFTRPILDQILNKTRIDGGMGLGALLNLCLLLVGLILLMRSSRKEFPREQIKAWVIFLFFMILAVLYSPFMTRAIRLFLNHMTVFTMFLIPFLLIRSRKDFEYWFSLLVCSFILPVLIGDFDFLRGGRMTADAGMRIFGSFSHPNILSFYLVLALTACTIYLFHYGSQIGRFKKNGILLLIANIIFLIIATKTRNAWLAAFVLFAIYGFLRNRRLLIVLLLLGTCSLALPPVQERVRDLFCNQQERTYRGVNSWDWRIEMWKSSFTMIKERPVFGYGLTTFVPYSSKFSNNVNMGAHNVYIELLFESGIGGMLSSFILYCVAAFWFFRRMKIEHNLLFSKVLCISGAYVTSYILVSMADNMLYYLVLNWYVWFFIGLMMQGQLLREKEIS